MYPVNWPLWKLFAKVGIPLRFMLTIHFDEESKTFWADSPNMDGLVVTGETLEEARREAMLAANMLLELKNIMLKNPLSLRERGWGEGSAKPANSG